MQHVYKCVGVGNGTKPTSGSISYFDPCVKEEGCGWPTDSGTLLKAPPKSKYQGVAVEDDTETKEKKVCSLFLVFFFSLHSQSTA